MQTHTLQIALRPGERIVANRIDRFNLALWNAYQSDRACIEAPADLSGLDDEELRGLRICWLNRDRRLPFDALTIELGDRIGDEFARRHMDSAGRRSALADVWAA